MLIQYKNSTLFLKTNISFRIEAIASISVLHIISSMVGWSVVGSDSSVEGRSSGVGISSA